MRVTATARILAEAVDRRASCRFAGSVGEALGNILPLAVAVAVFPVTIIAVVLVLASERGTAKGLAFVLAWCVGLAAVGASALLLGGVADANDDGAPATWVDVLLLGLGLALLALAVQQWRGRPSAGEETPVPSWMRAMDAFTVPRAAGAGFALSGLNPKNVLLVVAAAAEIVELGLPAGQDAAVLAVFVVIASVGVLTPLVL